MDVHLRFQIIDVIERKDEVKLKSIISLLPGGRHNELRYRLLDVILRDDEGKIKFLLNCGININYKFIDGNTPFEISIDFGKFKVFKILLEYGPEYNLEKIKCKYENIPSYQEYIKYIEDFEEKKRNKKGIPRK